MIKKKRPCDQPRPFKCGLLAFLYFQFFLDSDLGDETTVKASNDHGTPAKQAEQTQCEVAR